MRRVSLAGWAHSLDWARSVEVKLASGTLMPYSLDDVKKFYPTEPMTSYARGVSTGGESVAPADPDGGAI